MFLTSSSVTSARAQSGSVEKQITAISSNERCLISRFIGSPLKDKDVRQAQGFVVLTVLRVRIPRVRPRIIAVTVNSELLASGFSNQPGFSAKGPRAAADKPFASGVIGSARAPFS